MKKRILNLMNWEDIREIVEEADRLLKEDPDRNYAAPEYYYGEVLSNLMDRSNCTFRDPERYEFLLSCAESAAGRKLSPTREYGNTLIRCLVAHQLRKEGYSYSEIGAAMGKKHSTALYLVRKMDDMLSVPKMFDKETKAYNLFTKSLEDEN